ncbi:MAG: class I SAM-dependent methyltransferase [Magnetococcales bacterium]|nr:class I SAM-dependent methyltransferase [Magnetococcales bacterium]
MSFSCLVCGSSSIDEFLNLGSTPLANRFITPTELGQTELSAPLKVGFCHSCTHIQLTHLVAPAEMFSHYLYISSMSDTLKAHLADLAQCVVNRVALRPSHFVVDIGANDGTLLSSFRRHGVQTLGVDPAANLAQIARQNGIDMYTAFFGRETAQKIVSQWGQAQVITATNTFPHLPKLTDFLAGLDILLAPGGFFVLEAHYLQDILDQLAFDTVYHEHCHYWSLAPMMRLFRDHNFEIVDVERIPLHHGQLRVWVQRRGVSVRSHRVDTLLAAEQQAGLRQISTFRHFSERVTILKNQLCQTIDHLLSQGKKIAGYGAPAKGNTLLTFLGLGPDRIVWIADRSPLKQGRLTPGTHIPIVDPERITQEQPDYLLLLAWNFADEVMQQQKLFRDRGGQFILPVPTVSIFT